MNKKPINLLTNNTTRHSIASKFHLVKGYIKLMFFNVSSLSLIGPFYYYSTVTLLAKLRGLSTSRPRPRAV